MPGPEQPSETTGSKPQFPFMPKSGIHRPPGGGAPTAPAPPLPVPTTPASAASPATPGTAAPSAPWERAGVSRPPVPAPAAPPPVRGAILSESEIDSVTDEDRARSRKIIVFGIVFLVVVVLLSAIVGISWMQAEARHQEEVANRIKAGSGTVFSVAPYQVCRSRMLMLATISQRHHDVAGAWVTSFDPLLQDGASPTMRNDAWNHPYEFRGSRILTYGQDGNPDTPDDMWVDAASLETGGYNPQVELPTALMPGDMGNQLRRIVEQGQQMQTEGRHALDRQQMEIRRRLEEGDEAYPTPTPRNSSIADPGLVRPVRTSEAEPRESDLDGGG